MRALKDLLFIAPFFLFFAHGAQAYTVTVTNASELATEIAGASDGTTILLESGPYGKLSISNHNNSSPVIIAAAPGADPVFSGVNITNSSFWTLRDLTVAPRYTSGANYQHAVYLNGNDLVFENSRVNYTDDSTGWSASDWVDRAANGIAIYGTRLTVSNNDVTNVANGIYGSASYSLVSNNRITNFRSDGLLGLGDHTTFEYNTVKNCYKVDGNHDDGFQSWSNGPGGVGTGEVVGVTLRGNTILRHEDPSNPLACTLQGIGLFDGNYRDWTIVNNLVVTNHWHGISIYGAVDSTIINNTVTHSEDLALTDQPWIMIHDHKNGNPSVNTIMRNNIAHDLRGGIQDHNIEVNTEYSAADLFTNPAQGDFTLKDGSPAIDAGSTNGAPSLDYDGNVRPQGSAIDIGAYEFVAEIPKPNKETSYFLVPLPNDKMFIFSL